MSIKIGDSVVTDLREMGNESGVVEYISPEGVAIVRVGERKLKIRLEHLKPDDNSVTLTRKEFNRIIAQLMHEDNFSELTENSYAILKASSELIFARLEAMLFGGDNG